MTVDRSHLGKSLGYVIMPGNGTYYPSIGEMENTVESLDVEEGGKSANFTESRAEAHFQKPSKMALRRGRNAMPKIRVYGNRSEFGTISMGPTVMQKIFTCL